MPYILKLRSGIQFILDDYINFKDNSHKLGYYLNDLNDSIYLFDNNIRFAKNNYNSYMHYVTNQYNIFTDNNKNNNFTKITKPTCIPENHFWWNNFKIDDLKETNMPQTQFW